MRLINGRGQLGEALAKLDVKSDAVVYHTWNHLEKDEGTQRDCYEKYIAFYKKEQGRLIFISTSSENDNAYVDHKRMAERFANGVVRLPTLIGRGICERFRDRPEVAAWGIMELLPVEKAAKAVAEYVQTGRSDVLTVPGVRVPAKLVKELIQFGARR
jgi:hypothetical protein